MVLENLKLKKHKEYQKHNIIFPDSLVFVIRQCILRKDRIGIEI